VKLARAAFAVACVAPAAAAQLADLQPGRNFVSEANFGAGRSAELDAADVDLDGDFDVAVANGDDGAAELQRLFINDGRGVFTDETAKRFVGFPLMKARDLEFFDAENDGDSDLMISEDTKGIASPGGVSRFFVNQGGAQRGEAGVFQETTDQSWGALQAVPAGQQLCGGCDTGPFRDFACDCDFNDLDDDGDTDLFFSTYGPANNGSFDSRVFLNDGLGVFNEEWPWTDAFGDTSWISFECDLADLDGDFDLDLVTSGWSGNFRVFLNNQHGIALGPRLYHEITQNAVLSTGAGPIGNSNYEVEFGDADADGDFDVWSVNHLLLGDRLLRNNGPDAGGFAFSLTSWIKNEPNTDEEDGDFGDYDNDGDLDGFVANFSGTNWLYQSSLAQGLDPDTQGLYHRTGVASGLAPAPELPAGFNGGQSLDGEWFDVDGDDDLDILLSNDDNQGNWLFRNVLGVPDTHAPTLQAVTVQGDKPSGTETVVHASVRDNSPLQLFRSYGATLVYTVDGGAPQLVPMFHQGGQQFRAVIPAQSNATVAYHVEVGDPAGNTGVSGTTSFLQGALIQAPWTQLDSGLPGVTGIPVLFGVGSLTPATSGSLDLSNAAPAAPSLLMVSLASTPTPFKCGTLVPVPVAFQLFRFTLASGQYSVGWSSWPASLSGASLYFQWAVADAAAPCGVALSNALRADVP
jgi:hypothetical protein